MSAGDEDDVGLVFVAHQTLVLVDAGLDLRFDRLGLLLLGLEVYGGVLLVLDD